MDTNNISTIATFIAIILSAVLSYFGYYMNQTEAVPVITGLITLIIAVWSSKNPNTLKCLGNQPDTEEDDAC